MWFEVVIAVLILIYIYKVDIVNITIFDILKIIFLAILAIMVYNYVKDYHLMDELDSLLPLKLIKIEN